MKKIIPIFVPVLTLLILFLLIKNGNDLRLREITLEGCFIMLLDNLLKLETWTKLSLTLYISFKGVIGGLITAIFLGLIVSYFPKTIRSFTYLLNGWRSIPLTLLIPFLTFFPVLLLYPIGITETRINKDPAILISLGAFQYLFLGILNGIDKRSLSREEYFTFSRNYSRLWYIKNILFFEILPTFLYSLRLSILFAIVLAIVLELLTLYPGIGLYINQLSNNYLPSSTMQMIGLLTLVAYTGVFIDFIYTAITNYILRWVKN